MFFTLPGGLSGRVADGSSILLIIPAGQGEKSFDKAHEIVQTQNKQALRG
jgi:hypothetical protein